MIYFLVLVLTIFNEGAYLTFKSIFRKAHQFRLVHLWNHARISSWNKPVLSSKGKVSCSKKQRGPSDSVVGVHQEQQISHTLLKFWQIRVLGVSGWSESRFMFSPLKVQTLITLYQRIPQLNETSTLISINAYLSCYNSSYEGCS